MTAAGTRYRYTRLDLPRAGCTFYRLRHQLRGGGCQLMLSNAEQTCVGELPFTYNPWRSLAPWSLRVVHFGLSGENLAFERSFTNGPTVGPVKAGRLKLDSIVGRKPRPTMNGFSTGGDMTYFNTDEMRPPWP